VNFFSKQIALFKSTNAAAYYTLLGDDVMEGFDQGFVNNAKPLWLNLGYWREERTYRTACEAMARHLAVAATFRSGDTVLDVGFGFGEQDLLWLREYDLAHIHGINVTPLQVSVARRRMASAGLESRIHLGLGDATKLPFPDGTFDRVVALECAFHFNTRERFFSEAERVLKPGGTIALADMLPWEGRGTNVFQRLLRRRASIPEQNMYSASEYTTRLHQSGLQDVTIQPISEYVYPGCFAYLLERYRNGGGDTYEKEIKIADQDITKCRGRWLWGLGGLHEYVIVTATK
jgi:microcystin synthetase protein McyJ